MRVLFVVPPLVGHVHPTVAVAKALQARGHEVAWAAHPTNVRPLLPDGAHLIPLPEDTDRQWYDAVVERARTARGATALKLLWQDFFVPLARMMLPAVDAAIVAYAPDVLCVDQQAIAGAIVGRRRGLRWASLATTSAGLVEPLADLPQVRQWRDDLLVGLAREAGVDAAPGFELSPRRVIAFTTSALVGPVERFPGHFRFVGPAIGRADRGDFPWDRLVPRRRVLVSMGTVNADASARFYDTAIAALSGLGLQIVVAGPERDVPDDVIVQRWVPQLALLPHVDAVVCHAGHNTVCEALAHGVPLVVAPIKDDQPIVAEQVVAAGAGVRVRFGRVQADELRAATLRVLHEPGFRAAAARVRDSFATAGGAEAAARALEEPW